MAWAAGGALDTTGVCPWALQSSAERAYHDREWGRPLHDERALFEFLCLEGAQAGLSWRTILGKRPHYRAVFDDFDVERVARYDLEKVERLMRDPGIVRNRLKIEAVVANARACLAMRGAGTSFGEWMWTQVDGRPLVGGWREPRSVPPSSALSTRISTDLRRRGFRFVGPVVIQSFMKATGMINAHLVGCPQHDECRRAA